MSSFFKGDISPDLEQNSLLFTGYEDHCLKINNEPCKSSLSIHQGKLIAPWMANRVRDISIESLEMFLEHTPEVLIIGTGRTTAFPDATVLQWLAEHHIGFECMDSRAAARTYNILMAEGRPVSAAMLLPGSRR